MSFNYTLKYRSFDQLMSDIHTDFSSYKLADLIEPQELIRVVKKCNYALGLRIQETKEQVLDMERGRVKLPNDFNVLNYAFVCDGYKTESSLPQGTHIEEVPLYQSIPDKINLCTQPNVNCETKVCGCGSSTCGCATGNACTCNDCSCDLTSNTCQSTTVSSSTSDTTTETTNRASWLINLDTINLSCAKVGSYGIWINGEPIFMGDTPLTLQGLNALGKGIFTFQVINGTQTLITATGDYDYGDIIFFCKSTWSYSPTIETITSCVITNNNAITSSTSCINLTDQYCNKPRVMVNCKGDTYELVQYVNPTTVHTYSVLIPLNIIDNPQTIECGCLNLYVNSQVVGWIKDGYLYSNLTNATIYINYQGMMEDDNGNLMTPDHDFLNEYYEYSIKERILENLFFKNTPNIERQLQYVQVKLKESKIQAMSLVNTPNFEEMKKLWETNRRAQYSKYYDMFKSGQTINGTYGYKFTKSNRL